MIIDFEHIEFDYILFEHSCGYRWWDTQAFPDLEVCPSCGAESKDRDWQRFKAIDPVRQDDLLCAICDALTLETSRSRACS